MAAYVAGISRLASVAMGTLTGRQGMTMWYGLMGVRLVALFVADRPWANLRSDFICNGTLSPYCWAGCFNSHFSFPMDVLWHFSYVVVVLPIICLYQITPRAKPYKGPPLEAPPPPLVETFSRPKGRGWLAWMAVICPFCMVAIEAAFLCILAQVQLPLVAPRSILCFTPACSRTVVKCVLYARAEKLAAIAVLATASTLNILVGLVYIVAVGLTDCCHRM